MDSQKLIIYINAAVNNDETFEILKSKYTEILADLVSFKTNPNCSCKNRVSAFITKKYTESPEDKIFLDDLFKRPDVVESYERLSKFLPQRMGNPRIISGQIFKIPKTDEGWAALTKDIAGAQFRSFNILKKKII